MKSKDFEYKDLPKRRKEVVFYLLKNRRSSLLGILLLSILFSIPFYFWLIYSRYFFMNMSDYHPVNFVLMNAFPGLFLSFLYGVGLSGIFYSLRRLLFMDTLRLPYHFFKGIKESGFEFGLFVSIFYIFYTAFDCVDKLTYTYIPSIYVFITIIIAIIDILLFFMLFFVLSSASLYIVSFRQAFKDAFKNAFKGFYKNIIQYIFGFFPLIFLYFYINPLFLYINLIGVLFMVLVYNVLGPLFNLPIAYDLFDESINKVSYPKYYKKGLYKDEA